MRFLGIDYGLKRIGLAISDEAGEFAFPYGVLETDKALDKIGGIIKDENIAAVIVGLPGKFGGKESDVARSVKPFVKLMEDKCSVKVIFVPEIFTTKIAQKNQTDSKIKEIDASAAALILQSYLDGQKK